jgi:hypothetical protein
MALVLKTSDVQASVGSNPTLSALKFISISMKINLWYCEQMEQWRWTLTDDHRPIVKQESGQRPNLRDAMNDVANTVEYMLGN